MKKTSFSKGLAAALLTVSVTVAVVLCSVLASASPEMNSSMGNGVLGDLGRAAQDVGEGIREGIEDVTGNSSESADNNGWDNANGSAPIGQGGTENSGNNNGNVTDSRVDTPMDGTMNRREGDNGDGVVENGNAGNSTLGDEKARTGDGDTVGDTATDSGADRGGTNWVAVWIAVILAAALIGVILALIPKRRA